MEKNGPLAALNRHRIVFSSERVPESRPPAQILPSMPALGGWFDVRGPALGGRVLKTRDRLSVTQKGAPDDTYRVTE